VGGAAPREREPIEAIPDSRFGILA